MFVLWSLGQQRPLSLQSGTHVPVRKSIPPLASRDEVQLKAVEQALVAHLNRACKWMAPSFLFSFAGSCYLGGFGWAWCFVSPLFQSLVLHFHCLQSRWENAKLAAAA